MSPDRYGTPEFDLDFGGTASAGTERLQPPRTVAQAMCPSCHRSTADGKAKTTALVRQGEHLVWREHDIVTWGGAKIPCRASGTTACSNPPKSAAFVQAVRCPHDRLGDLDGTETFDTLDDVDDEDGAA